MKKLFPIMVAVCISMLILAACGSQEANKPSTSMSVEMSEFKFVPDTFTVYANQEISLTLKNVGAVDHDFTILKKGKVAATPFDRDKQAADILVDNKLSAGQTGNYTFTLPEPGDYQIICSVQGHMESGMVAKLTAVSK